MLMLSLLLWIGFGAIIGWTVSALLRNDDDGTSAPSVALGIVGAAIGGLLFHRGNAPEIFRVGSFATAFLGAVVLLAIANLATRGRVR